jgi:hypothetical protein
VESCSAIKNNEVWSFPTTWVRLVDGHIAINETSQAQKDKQDMLSCMWEASSFLLRITVFHDC